MTNQTNAADLGGEFGTEINQSLNKYVQGIKDENKFKRKSALELMKKQLIDSFKAPAGGFKYTPESLKTVLRLTLGIVSDSAEKCREIACDILDVLLENEPSTNGFWDTDMTSMTLMQLHQRLSGREVKETSEEIRLRLYIILHRLVELKATVPNGRHTFEMHLTELVAMLVNAFNDLFPEVKKQGCACARLIAARLASANFHAQSESLVKPLLSNMTHQHSRVRKDVVDTLCEVVLRGNNKSVSDCVSHLAQRLFDQASSVRMAVVRLAGTWLLDLPDRYSFHYKLMPLLLTGFVDEAAEVRDAAEALWWDVGVKYEKENEHELKDKSDFVLKNMDFYPTECK
jgi:dynein assembly factor 5